MEAEVELTRNFVTDFDVMVRGLARKYDGPPYSFSRFGDGELAVINGSRYAAHADRWYVEGWTKWRRPLLDALAYVEHQWHVGLTARDHDADVHNELMALCWSPRERVTFAELFIFGNYQRFAALDLSSCCIVSHCNGHVTIPAQAIMQDWDHRYVVDYLIANVRQPILVAAGPLAAVIIHDYWQRADNKRQVILDVGSAIDPQTRNRNTRRYHKEGSDLQKRVLEFN